MRSMSGGPSTSHAGCKMPSRTRNLAAAATRRSYRHASSMSVSRRRLRSTASNRRPARCETFRVAAALHAARSISPSTPLGRLCRGHRIRRPDGLARARTGKAHRSSLYVRGHAGQIIIELVATALAFAGYGARQPGGMQRQMAERDRLVVTILIKIDSWYPREPGPDIVRQFEIVEIPPLLIPRWDSEQE